MPGRGRPTLLPALAAGSALLLGCAARPRQPIGDLAGRRAQLAALVGCGSYVCLGQAETLAGDLLRLAPEGEGLRADRIRVLLLLALRERQLGILGDGHLEEARRLLGIGDASGDLSVLADGVAGFPFNAGGVAQDRQEPFDAASQVSRRERRRRLADWVERHARAADPAPADLAFLLAFAQGSDPEDLAAVAAASSGSASLVLFSRAWVTGDPGLAEALLARDPAYHEAHLILGRGALVRGRPALAERELRRAFEALPASLAAGMGLADTLFTLEELAPALEAYQGVLAMAPTHREAQLRKGIVLSQLGRGEEAIRALQRMVDLGFWYLGEAHYWLAWNEQRGGRGDAARAHIELARHSLPDDPRVHELDGRLELERHDVAAAERAFRTVLEIDARWPGRYSGHDALCDSLVALGRIESGRGGWDQAASYFERAAYCDGTAAALIEQDIERIRSWSLAAPRQARLLAKKQRLRDDALRRRAGYLYNAAASALNARKREWCLGLARRAAEHPAYEQKAEALIDKARHAAF